MNRTLFRSLCVAAAAAAFLSGCSKQPMRPSPASTVLGPQGSTAPVDATFGQETTGLTDRGSDFDPNGHNRTALQAQAVLFDFDKSDVRASEREKLKAAKERKLQEEKERAEAEGGQPSGAQGYADRPCASRVWCAEVSLLGILHE